MTFGYRVATTITATVTALLLTATAAFAGLCYNASRSSTGNANAVNGQALGSAEDFIALLKGIPPCAAEGAALEAALLEEFDEDDLDEIVVNERTVMAQGVVGTDLSDDGQGIDHLTFAHEEIKAAVECLMSLEP